MKSSSRSVNSWSFWRFFCRCSSFVMVSLERSLTQSHYKLRRSIFQSRFPKNAQDRRDTGKRRVEFIRFYIAEHAGRGVPRIASKRRVSRQNAKNRVKVPRIAPKNRESRQNAKNRAKITENRAKTPRIAPLGTLYCQGELRRLEWSETGAKRLCHSR